MNHSKSIFTTVFMLLLRADPLGQFISDPATSIVLAQTGPAYQLTKLSNAFSPAMDINDDGTIVGYHQLPTALGTSRGYIWTASSGIQPMVTTTPEINQFPQYPDDLRVNSFGIIAGSGKPDILGGGNSQAAFYSPTGVLQFLIHPQFGVNGAGGARDINNTGTVVGIVGSPDVPFIWTSSDDLRLIPTKWSDLV